jgi:hypothetical protein
MIESSFVVQIIEKILLLDREMCFWSNFPQNLHTFQIEMKLQFEI